MNALSHLVRLVGAALLLSLAACGGGGGDSAAPPPAPQSASALIGAAGGTLSGPNGATVVIPPGALATDTTIAIEQTKAGAPPLPGGFSVSGSMFALTPHGTTFAAPVTVSLPFDAASVPAGSTPALYKTNAQNQWERVAGATFGANSVSAQITSFSHAQAVIELIKGPLRQWHLFATKKDSSWGVLTSPYLVGEQRGGEVRVPFLFGAANPEFEQDNGETPGLAMGEVFSSPDGHSFSAYAEAPGVLVEAPPGGDPASDGDPLRSGGVALLRQFQSYVKRTADATLQLVLSAGFLAAADFNGRPLPHECIGAPPDVLSDEEIPHHCIPLLTAVEFKVVAFTGPSGPGNQPEFFSTHGIAEMVGFDGRWRFLATSDAQSGTPLWTNGNFTATGLDGNTPLVALNAPRVIDIDLSSIEVCPPDLDAIFCADKAFTIFSFISAETWNWRGGESGAAAYLRDPQNTGGGALQMSGLEATNSPLPLPTQQPAPVACDSGPDPAAGVLQFSTGSYSALEGTGTRGARDIIVTRTQGSKGAVSVNFSAGGGTAMSGVDYDAPAVTVRFADGDSAPRRLTLNLLSNTIAEPDKTVTLTLSSPGGCATLGPQAAALLTIQDDDGAPPQPPSSFSIGGTVTGLVGTGLVLRSSGGGDLAPANGAFTFGIPMPNGFPYSVSVATQPANPLQICTVSNGSGTVANANVTDVAVDCVTPATSGALDASFGDAGKVSTAFGGDDTAMALQADGKIVMVGGVSGDFVLARYNADGSLDAGFGSRGLVTTDFLGNVTGNEAHGVALQTDGKIVVVGFAVVGRTSKNLSNFDFALARYNADGSLDASFGAGGRVTTDFNAEADRGFAVAIQPDGKIVVVGDVGFDAPSGQRIDFGIARYNGNGTLDASFGVGGKLAVDIAGGTDLARNVVLRADGAIVVSGPHTSPGDSGLDHTGVTRLDANGGLDTSFGSGGKVTLTATRVDDGLALADDGRILLAGSVDVGAPPDRPSDFALMRLAANGSPDSGFGSAGLVTTPFSTLSDFGRAVALQADGKIVVAGQMDGQGSNPDFAVARYHADGSLDAAFGSGGKLTIDFFGASDGADSVAVQPDGKVVLGGFARNGSRTGYALVRVAP